MDVVGSGCERWREAISARVDGEQLDEPGLVEHLDGCPACRSFERAVGVTSRRVKVRPARSMPDLSLAVAARVAVADRRGARRFVRALLALTGAFILVQALPALVLGEGDESVHAARHLGAFSTAYAVALLVVAVRPARARTVLPVAVVLAAALFITAAIDIVDGEVPFLDETTHLPELASMALVWLLATPDRRRQDPARQPVPLRVVPPPADHERRAAG